MNLKPNDININRKSCLTDLCYGYALSREEGLVDDDAAGDDDAVKMQFAAVSGDRDDVAGNEVFGGDALKDRLPFAANGRSSQDL